MHQALQTRNREKRPQPTCKRHNRENSTKKKLASMSNTARAEYLSSKANKVKARWDERKAANIRAHELRLKESRRIGRKHTRKKVHKKIIATMKQVVSIKKEPPSKETIVRRNNNAQQRRLKRRLLKIIHYAERKGINYILVVKKLFLDLGLHLSQKLTQVKAITRQLLCAGVKNIPVSKYQKIALAP